MSSLRPQKFIVNFHSRCIFVQFAPVPLVLNFFFSWREMPYRHILGILSIICIILWYFFATNNPNDCKFISEEEASYLKKAIGTVNQEENIKV